MKPSPAPTTTGQLVELIRQCGILSPAELVEIEQRWPREAGETADVARFVRWLVARGYLTEYQTALLLHGHTAALFLGPYKLLERIGRGNLAVVYRAVRAPDEVIALKVLPPSRARDRRLRARFRNEAGVACQLQHPNVVRALEAGEADGVHYLVLEYLHGENLREAMAHRGPLPIADVLHIARQTLAGLQYLFEQGLVHRNLEPANLMLALPAGSDFRAEPLTSATVKILDTSLSRSLFEDRIPEGGAGHSQLTFEGHLLGTPAYLAPEQARDAHAADIRADLYSLGCILFHALTGAPPFQDASALGVVIRHAAEMPRPVRELRGDVPVALAQTIGRLLAKDPANLFAKPLEVAAALPETMEDPAIVTAVLVAPPAAPRVARAAIPMPAVAVPRPAGPVEADMSVELVAPAELAEPYITVELVPAVKPALPAVPQPAVPVAAAADDALVPVPLLSSQAAPHERTTRPRGPNRCLYVLLGGLGLLIVQILGWLLAQLVVLFLG